MSSLPLFNFISTPNLSGYFLRFLSTFDQRKLVCTLDKQHSRILDHEISRSCSSYQMEINIRSLLLYYRQPENQYYLPQSLLNYSNIQYLVLSFVSKTQESVIVDLPITLATRYKSLLIRIFQVIFIKINVLIIRGLLPRIYSTKYTNTKNEICNVDPNPYGWNQGSWDLFHFYHVILPYPHLKVFDVGLNKHFLPHYSSFSSRDLDVDAKSKVKHDFGYQKPVQSNIMYFDDTTECKSHGECFIKKPMTRDELITIPQFTNLIRIESQLSLNLFSIVLLPTIKIIRIYDLKLVHFEILTFSNSLDSSTSSVEYLQFTNCVTKLNQYGDEDFTNSICSLFKRCTQLRYLWLSSTLNTKQFDFAAAFLARIFASKLILTSVQHLKLEASASELCSPIQRGILTKEYIQFYTKFPNLQSLEICPPRKNYSAILIHYNTYKPPSQMMLQIYYSVFNYMQNLAKYYSNLQIYLNDPCYQNLEGVGEGLKNDRIHVGKACTIFQNYLNQTDTIQGYSYYDYEHADQERDRNKIQLYIFDLDDCLIHEGFDEQDPILYHETLQVLQQIRYVRKAFIALASHNCNGKNIIHKLNLQDYFDFYSCHEDASRKVSNVTEILQHFPNIPLTRIEFYDDVEENAKAIVEQLNITSIVVNHECGISLNDLS